MWLYFVHASHRLETPSEFDSTYPPAYERACVERCTQRKPLELTGVISNRKVQQVVQQSWKVGTKCSVFCFVVQGRRLREAAAAAAARAIFRLRWW